MTDGPEFQIIKLPDLLGDEWRAERDRQRDEARQRYLDRLVEVLAAVPPSSSDRERAGAVLDGLFVTTRREDGQECLCSCHPRVPDSDLHGYGFACPCRLTAARRQAAFKEWMTELEAYQHSPEGRREAAARQAEEDELLEWLADHPDVVVTSHGGMCPEQWRGSVEGRSFYFRERHDDWRIEVDLRPSGRFYRSWMGGDLTDDASYELRETDEGDVIAEGTTGVAGYGRKPVQRVGFIASTIRTHLDRERCRVHTDERDDLELLFGRPLDWCPSCGLSL